MPATTEIYTLSLHDALPISGDEAEDDRGVLGEPFALGAGAPFGPDFLYVHGHRRLVSGQRVRRCGDRKSTRLNSSHVAISYAVFCLKEKNNKSRVKNF